MPYHMFLTCEVKSTNRLGPSVGPRGSLCRLELIESFWRSGVGLMVWLCHKRWHHCMVKYFTFRQVARQIVLLETWRTTLSCLGNYAPFDVLNCHFVFISVYFFHNIMQHLRCVLFAFQPRKRRICRRKLRRSCQSKLR